MKQLFFFLLLLIITTTYGQRYPNEFPVDNTPSGTDAFYTQEAVAGTPTARKMYLSVLKTWFAQDLTISNDTIFLSEGGFVVVPPADSTVFSTLYALQDTAEAVRAQDDSLYTIADGSVLASISDPVQNDLALNAAMDSLWIFDGTGWVAFSGGSGLWSPNANGVHPAILSDNVGIGMNLPLYPLDASGNTNIARFVAASPISIISLHNSASGSTVASDGLAISITSTAAAITNRENGLLTFGTNNTGRVNITGAGQLQFNTYGTAGTWNLATASQRIPVFDGNGNIWSKTPAALATELGASGGGLWSANANGIHNTGLLKVGIGTILPTSSLHVYKSAIGTNTTQKLISTELIRSGVGAAGPTDLGFENNLDLDYNHAEDVEISESATGMYNIVHRNYSSITSAAAEIVEGNFFGLQNHVTTTGNVNPSTGDSGISTVTGVRNLITSNPVNNTGSTFSSVVYGMQNILSLVAPTGTANHLGTGRGVDTEVNFTSGYSGLTITGNRVRLNHSDALNVGITNYGYYLTNNSKQTSNNYSFWSDRGEHFIQTGLPELKGYVVKGAVAQIANLFEAQNSSGTALTVIDAAGNAGIGTSTPTSKLEVAGTTLINNQAASATLQIKNNTNLWSIYGLNGSNNFIVKPSTNEGDILFRDLAGTTILTVETDDEQVGIGTENPGYKLEVVGTFKMGDAIRYIEHTVNSLYQKYVSGANVTTAGLDPGGSFDIDVTSGTGFSNWTNTNAGVIYAGSNGTISSTQTIDYKGINLGGNVTRTNVVVGSITANKDNFNSAGYENASRVKFTLDAAWNLTGYDATYAVDGTEVACMVSGGAFTIKHDQTSTAANRYDLPSDTDLVIPDGGGWIQSYDTTISRWRVIAVNK